MTSPIRIENPSRDGPDIIRKIVSSINISPVFLALIIYTSISQGAVRIIYTLLALAV